MKKLLFFAVIAASYYIAGMYRQLPLMIFAVMEWVLLLFLLFLSRHLRKNLSLSLPAQNDEAEKDTVKKCYIRIARDGRLPLKKVRLQLRLYNDNDVLLLKKSISQTINAASGIMEFSFCPSQCGILRIQICRMFVYDYLSLFCAAKPAETEFSIVVFPSARPLPLLPPLRGECRRPAARASAAVTDKVFWQREPGYPSNTGIPHGRHTPLCALESKRKNRKALV